MTIGKYTELAAWQVSMALVGDVYRQTARMPMSERYGLVQQMRRAAISVPSNIAEGHSRHSRREYLRFVVVALGSLAELETQILIANHLGYVADDAMSSLQQRLEHAAKLLRGLEQRLAREVPRFSATA